MFGHLAEVDGNAVYPYNGRLSTLSVDMPVVLAVNDDRRNDNSPDYLVLGKSPNGNPVQIGVAWRHSIGKGERAGKSMFSLVIDNPELPRMDLAAWPVDDMDGRWTVSGNRSRDPATRNGTAAPAGDTGAAIGDELPFG